MTDTSYLPLLALVTASPVLLAIVSEWQRRVTRKEQWSRDDVVADRLLDSQKLVAKEAKAVATTLSVSAKSTDKQLRTIHTLVNSNLSLAKENELTALRTNLVLLRRLSGLLGVDPEITAAVLALEPKVMALETEIADRERAAAETEGN